jgi:hypothetical protein
MGTIRVRFSVSAKDRASVDTTTQTEARLDTVEAGKRRVADQIIAACRPSGVPRVREQKVARIPPGSVQRWRPDRTC